MKYGQEENASINHLHHFCELAEILPSAYT